MRKIYDAARHKMKGYCRVCPVCDGRPCGGEVPGMGGLGTGAGFRNNIAALARLQLRMKVIHTASEPDLSVNLFGRRLSMPVLAAPIGGTAYNMGENSLPEQAYSDAIVQGCLEQGVLGCTGDGPLNCIFECALNSIRKAQGAAIPFIKPWEGEELFAKIEQCGALGCPAIGMDADAIGLITLRKMGRPVSPKGPAEIAAVTDAIHRTGAKCVIKGILTPEDALSALQAGADGIVVSNHGGRVLDYAAGTADALPGIAAAVQGRMVVLADGGVRSGVDVLKMLALGADAVLIGRPCAIAAVGDPQAGVAAYLTMIREQLTSAMILTGMPDIASLGPHVFA